VWLRRRSRGAVVAAAVDGEEAEEEEEEIVRQARERLLRQFAGTDGFGEAIGGGMAFAGSGAGGTAGEDPFWVEPATLESDGLPSAGSVVLAHPAAYLRPPSEEEAARQQLDMDEEVSAKAGAPVAARRTGLPPVADPGAQRRDRGRLPVVLITERTVAGTSGLLLVNWSGRLLGDLGFMNFETRPLYIGGPLEERLAMIHAYPELPGSVQITADGLMLSNDFDAACQWINEGPGSPMRFKFFLYRVHWAPEEEAELAEEAGIWLPVRCSRDLILREPDSAFEEPLWAQIAEKAGGKLDALGREYELLASTEGVVTRSADSQRCAVAPGGCE